MCIIGPVLITASTYFVSNLVHPLLQTNSPLSRVNFLENEVNSLQVVVEMRTKQMHDAETIVQDLQKEVNDVMIILFPLKRRIM